MRIVLIRHTSVAVTPGVCYGQTDVPVAESFETEAEDVKHRLATYTFDRIYSSPLSRCTKLAHYCGYHNPLIDHRLIEMNFGDWEMQRFDEITDPRIEEWYSDYLHVRPTGGESSMEQRARLQEFIDMLKADKSVDTVALFTHGGILIHASILLGGLSDKEAFTSLPGYGAILEFHI